MSEPVRETSNASTAEPASSSPATMLRREAILPRERRGGLGAVAMLCSLAGVASGFALATTILATQIAQSEARFVRRSSMGSVSIVRERTFLGVEYNGNDPRAVVSRVKASSPAAEIGLKAGDVIQTYDGEPLDHPGELGRRIRASTIGHEPTLEVRRGDHSLILHPTLCGAMLRDDQL